MISLLHSNSQHFQYQNTYSFMSFLHSRVLKFAWEIDLWSELAFLSPMQKVNSRSSRKKSIINVSRNYQGKRTKEKLQINFISQNPFLPKRLGRTANNGTQSPASGQESGISSSPQHDATRDAKTERFHETGRSNSAPDSYDWHTSGR